MGKNRIRFLPMGMQSPKVTSAAKRALKTVVVDEDKENGMNFDELDDKEHDEPPLNFRNSTAIARTPLSVIHANISELGRARMLQNANPTSEKPAHEPSSPASDTSMSASNAVAKPVISPLDLDHSLGQQFLPHPERALSSEKTLVETPTYYGSCSIRRGYIHRQLMKPPKVGKIYYVPDWKLIPPASVIHNQKRQNGFYQHPILIISADNKFVYFYALTKKPPRSIWDLGMCIRIGDTTKDEGDMVVSLAEESDVMQYETWVNLEQRFSIEWENLFHWMSDVTVNPIQLDKIHRRVEYLESEQNRYIYKPLPRHLHSVDPGTVLMIPNPPSAATFGAPVLVLKNEHPHIRFLRVKLLYDNLAFGLNPNAKTFKARQFCLEICRNVNTGHDSTPVMLLEPESPEMREPSYIELSTRGKWGRIEEFKTWCWPPPKIRNHSMRLLWDILRKLDLGGCDGPTTNAPLTGVFPPPPIPRPPPGRIEHHCVARHGVNIRPLSFPFSSPTLAVTAHGYGPPPTNLIYDAHARRPRSNTKISIDSYSEHHYPPNDQQHNQSAIESLHTASIHTPHSSGPYYLSPFWTLNPPPDPSLRTHPCCFGDQTSSYNPTGFYAHDSSGSRPQIHQCYNFYPQPAFPYAGKSQSTASVFTVPR